MGFVTLVSGPGFAFDWSPTTNPADTPSWSSISSSTAGVRKVKIKRGRDRELDRFQAGEAQATLGNADRSFDPLYSAGPNFGNVLPEKRARAQAQWSAVTYDLVQGFIDGYPQFWDIGNKDATVELSITDAFKVLNQATLPTSMYDFVASQFTWTHWWKLTDGAGATSVIDSGTNPVPGTVRNATLGGSAVVPFDGGRTSASFPVGAALTGVLQGLSVTPSSGMTLAVASGTAVFDGATVGYAGGTVTLASADFAFGTSRVDTVVVGNVGTISVLQGTAAIFFPQAPSLPAGAIALANVFVGPSVSTITSSAITTAFKVLDIAAQDIVWPTAPWPHSTSAWTISVWFAAETQSSAEDRLVLAIGGSSGVLDNYYDIHVGNSSAGQLYVSYATPTRNISYSDTSGARYDLGDAHHIVATLDTDTKVRFYVDGTSVQTSGTNTVQAFGSDSYSLGSWFNEIYGEGIDNNQFHGRISHFGIIDGTALTATQVSDLYDAGVTALAGEDTGTRVGRVLDYIGWSSTDRNISTGASLIGGYDLSGGSALDYLNTLSDTEQGMFYVSADGKVTWRSRATVVSDTRSRVSQATFSDSGNLAYNQAAAVYDETKIFNDAKVTRQGGADQSSSDATSIGKYFKRTYSKTIVAASDIEAKAHAEWAVGRYKDPALRIEALIVKPRADPTNLWPQVLGREIGDRITFVKTPQGVGSAISQDVIIEGIQHDITADDWTTTFACSPTEAKQYWVLDDTTLSVLGTSTIPSF